MSNFMLLRSRERARRSAEQKSKKPRPYPGLGFYSNQGLNFLCDTDEPIALEYAGKEN